MQTYNSINSHVQQLPGSHNRKQSVDTIKYCYHHLVFVFRGRLVFRMRARMYYAVHVQVQIIKLYVIWIRLCSVLVNIFSIVSLLLKIERIN